jgi:hypothetical protein
MEKIYQTRSRPAFRPSESRVLNNNVRADCFVVKKRNLQIYRLSKRGVATLLCTSAVTAAHYFELLTTPELQADITGR